MMVKVRCIYTPAGDIRTRQPKSPGQKPQDHNLAKPANMIVGTVKEVWANSVKRVRDMPQEYRCTNCGLTGHGHA